MLHGYFNTSCSFHHSLNPARYNASEEELTRRGTLFDKADCNTTVGSVLRPVCGAIPGLMPELCLCIGMLEGGAPISPIELHYHLGKEFGMTPSAPPPPNLPGGPGHAI